jgi:toxin-antitoxin system PIN domain toxin
VSVTLDANILLYASDEESPLQARALEVIDERVGGHAIVYLFWPALVAYLRLSTPPAGVARPLEPQQSIANVETLLGRPRVRAPGEDGGFWSVFRSVLEEGPARGNLISDAHLVALARQYGVRTILTRDRDLRRFDGIRVVDPFTDA